MDLQVKCRKYESHLAVSGLAVIAFCLWGMIKNLYSFFIAPDQTLSTVEQMGMSRLEMEIFRTVYIVLFIFGILLDVFLRFFVGFSARSESHGKKKRVAYIVLACIIAAFSLYSYAYYLPATFRTTSILDTVVSAILEISSIAALIDLIVSAFLLKNVRKKISAQV